MHKLNLVIKTHKLKEKIPEDRRDVILSQKYLKTDKMAYISVYVLKGCVFPRKFHCPVSNDRQVEFRLRQRDDGTVSKCNVSNIFITQPGPMQFCSI